LQNLLSQLLLITDDILLRSNHSSNNNIHYSILAALTPIEGINCIQADFGRVERDPSLKVRDDFLQVIAKK
jgi:hypothetical protein